MNQSPYILGLDVGGTKMAAGIVTPGGQLVASKRSPTPPKGAPPEALATLVKLGRAVIDESGLPKDQITCAGLSIAGPMDMIRGIVFHLPNLPGWDYFPVRDYLSQHLGLPVFMENDANAAAVGEYHVGGHHDATRFIYLTISTGIGSGFLMDGRLYRGAGFGGTEFGHMNIKPGGYLCGCGARGCFEAHCSGRSIAKRAARRLAREKERPATPVTTQGFFQAAEQNQSWATALLRDIAQDFGRALGSIVNIIGPDRIVLGGGVANQWHLFSEIAQATLRQQAFNEFVDNVKIVKSERADDIALIGAAVVAHQNLE